MTEKISYTVKDFNLIVFGGDGDLAFYKLYPSLMYRFIDKQIKSNFNIIAISRKDKSKEEFIIEIEKHLKEKLKDFSKKEFVDFSKHISVVSLKENTKDEYVKLKAELDKNPNYQNIYYYSTPSSAFEEISQSLKNSGLINDSCKVVVEKPLGTDLKSFKAINNKLRAVFKENQIYRIDHYLGKETVQNLMVLRFTNHLFEKAWNRENIDNIQITVAESVGVNQRGNYYDNTGALLDMVQNHLLQLLCLVAMEPPSALTPENVRAEKLKVLNSIRHFTPNDAQINSVKGQYTRGNIDGKQVNSYLEDIAKYESDIDTFVALKVFVDNWRWKGVPFYMRTGKRMNKRYSEIVINFKPVSHNIFSDEEIPNNKLIITLQPEERIELVQMTKIPGPGGYRYKPISLKLDYLDSFDERLPDAYERLIIDVIRGNPTLFMSENELESSWKWIESITSSWKKNNTKNILYNAGSMGPGDNIMDNKNEWHQF